MQHKRLRCKCSGAMFYISAYACMCVRVCMQILLLFRHGWPTLFVVTLYCKRFEAVTMLQQYSFARPFATLSSFVVWICCCIFFLFVLHALCKWKRQIACGNLSLSQQAANTRLRKRVWLGDGGDAGQCILSLGLIAKRIKARVKRALNKQQILGSHCQAAPNWPALPPYLNRFVYMWVAMLPFVCACICLVGSANACVCVCGVWALGCVHALEMHCVAHACCKH